MHFSSAKIANSMPKVKQGSFAVFAKNVRHFAIIRAFPAAAGFILKHFADLLLKGHINFEKSAIYTPQRISLISLRRIKDDRTPVLYAPEGENTPNIAQIWAEFERNSVLRAIKPGI